MRVHTLGCRVQGSGFRDQGSGFQGTAYGHLRGCSTAIPARPTPLRKQYMSWSNNLRMKLSCEATCAAALLPSPPDRSPCSGCGCCGEVPPRRSSPTHPYGSCSTANPASPTSLQNKPRIGLGQASHGGAVLRGRLRSCSSAIPAYLVTKREPSAGWPAVVEVTHHPHRHWTAQGESAGGWLGGKGGTGVPRPQETPTPLGSP